MTGTEVAATALTREDFAALYPRLRRFAAVVGAADVEPDDLVQDALAAMLRRAEPPRNPEAYLRTSIVNRAISQSRHRARWSGRRPTIVGRQSAHADVYPSDTDLLGQLDPRARVVVWLLDVERWTSPEVAEMLGMREAAVRQQAARARKRLRAQLETEQAP